MNRVMKYWLLFRGFLILMYLENIGTIVRYVEWSNHQWPTSLVCFKQIIFITNASFETPELTIRETGINLINLKTHSRLTNYTRLVTKFDPKLYVWKLYYATYLDVCILGQPICKQPTTVPAQSLCLAYHSPILPGAFLVLPLQNFYRSKPGLY